MTKKSLLILSQCSYTSGLCPEVQLIAVRELGLDAAAAIREASCSVSQNRRQHPKENVDGEGK